MELKMRGGWGDKIDKSGGGDEVVEVCSQGFLIDLAYSPTHELLEHSNTYA